MNWHNAGWYLSAALFIAMCILSLRWNLFRRQMLKQLSAIHVILAEAKTELLKRRGDR
jgi:hypothetical protein